jgi:hypothetical protein
MMAVAYASTAWLTLAGWARPEIWALIPLAWAYLIYQDRKSQRSPPGGCPRAWLLHVAIACVGIGAFAIFNMAMWGQPFPSTLTGKAAFFQTWGGLTPGKMLTKLAELFLHNIQAIVDSQNPLAVICIGAAIVSARRQREQRSARLRQRPKIAWLGLALLLSILVASATPPGNAAFQTFRRTAHVLALTDILAAIGLMAIWSVLKPDTAQCLSGDAGTHGPEAVTWSRILRPEAVFLVAAVLLIAGMQWSGLQKGAEFYAQATRSINQGDVVAGRWLAANTPANALVVVNDIGALAYFGERRILDLAGLATPEVIPILAKTMPGSAQRDRGLKELLLAQKADYVVIFPTWYPVLSRDPQLVEIKRFYVPNPVALASDQIVAYRIRRTE